MAQARYFAFNQESSAIMLEATFDHARNSKDDYVFGPLQVNEVLNNGLQIYGDIDGLRSILDNLPGVSGYEEQEN